MTWFGLIVAIELGWLPGHIVLYDRIPAPYEYREQVWIESVESFTVRNLFFTKLQVAVILFDFLLIGGDVKTYIHIRSQPFGLVPNVADYGFEVGLTGDFPIGLYWKHRCIHPIMTASYRYDAVMKWEGAYNEIGIRIEAKIGGK